MSELIQIRHNGKGNPLVIGRRLLRKGATMDIAKKDLKHFLSCEAGKAVFDLYVAIVDKSKKGKSSSETAAAALTDSGKKGNGQKAKTEAEEAALKAKKEADDIASLIPAKK